MQHGHMNVNLLELAASLCQVVLVAHNGQAALLPHEHIAFGLGVLLLWSQYVFVC
jgi:hypothetical protein